MVGREGLRWCLKGKCKLSQSLNNLLHTITLFSKQSWVDIYVNNYCKVVFLQNIMVYRHPCIIKYVASWKKGLKCYLATERVQPLAQVLPSLTSLQICIGLQNILKALVFLHDSVSTAFSTKCIIIVQMVNLARFTFNYQQLIMLACYS